ncbi:MAG TPA: hypothetical protein VMW08_02610 [Acidimicrobiales bacterium]|nr:hypothetical protein [Acidimicrobiales bacterium]
MSITEPLDLTDREPVLADDPRARERRGRRWLMWSFIFCPCHLPVSMAVLAAVFGGSAFGTLISRNTLGVGIILGSIYVGGVAIGFRHLRAATQGSNCAAGECDLGPGTRPTEPA